MGLLISEAEHFYCCRSLKDLDLFYRSVNFKTYQLYLWIKSSGYGSCGVFISLDLVISGWVYLFIYMGETTDFGTCPLRNTFGLFSHIWGIRVLYFWDISIYLTSVPTYLQVLSNPNQARVWKLTKLAKISHFLTFLTREPGFLHKIFFISQLAMN